MATAVLMNIAARIMADQMEVAVGAEKLIRMTDSAMIAFATVLGERKSFLHSLAEAN